MRALSTETAASFTRATNPLRLSYTIFADANPWMAGVKALAGAAAAWRRPAAADNPFVVAQTHVSDQITAALDRYRIARDDIAERALFGFYGAPMVQAMLGIDPQADPRPAPSTTPARQTELAAERSAQAAMLNLGGYDEALIRAVLYVAEADRSIDGRSALALNVARQKLLHLSLDAFKSLVRDQFFVLQLDGESAVDALPGLVPEPEARKELLGHVEEIANAGAPLTAATRDRLARLAKVLPTAPGKPQLVALPEPRRDAAETQTRGGQVMSSLVNRTFDEIAVGETVSTARTLSAADLRAWGAAFGNQDARSVPGQSQDAAGLVTGILRRAGRLEAARPGQFDPHRLCPARGSIAGRLRDDGAARGAG